MSIELALRLTQNATVFVEYPLRVTAALFDTTVIQTSDSLPDNHAHVMFLVSPNVWQNMCQSIDFKNFLVQDASEPGHVGVYWSSFYTAPIYSSPKVGNNMLHVIIHDGRNCGGCSTFMVDLS